MKPEHRRYRAKILVPQSTGLWDPDSLNRMLDHLLKVDSHLDEDRVYCIGYSMGGGGTVGLAVCAVPEEEALLGIPGFYLRASEAR